MADDWLTDLAEFGPDVLSRACGEWRKTQSRRPTIADIRKLCLDDRDIGIVDGRAGGETYARSLGFPARREAIDARKQAFRLAEEWRNSPEARSDPAIANRRDWKPAISPIRTAEQMQAARRALGMEE